jgi:MFS family permease
LATERVKDAHDPEQLALDLESRATKKLQNQPAKPKIRMAYLKDAIREPKWYMFALTVGLCGICAAIFDTFSARLGAEMNQVHRGDSSVWFTSTSLFIGLVSPQILSLFSSVLLGYSSDSRGERAWHASIPLFLTGCSFFLMIFIQNPTFRYAMLFLIGPSLMSGFPIILTYAMDHAHGGTIRAIVGGAVLCLMSLGRILSLSLVPAEYTNISLNPNSGESTAFILGAICSFLTVALIQLIRHVYQQEEAGFWSRAHGLRRLMNDEQEAKAWGLDDEDERKDIEDEYSSKVASALGYSGKKGIRMDDDDWN